MARLRLIPQKREFFDLYSRASANTVEISSLLVELLERFPAEDGDLIVQIKEREHEVEPGVIRGDLGTQLADAPLDLLGGEIRLADAQVVG